MDDPVQIPQRLSSRPRDPDPDTPVRDGFHDFDLDLQGSPTCPEFRGVHVFRDFISPDEADRLLEEIEKASFVPAQSGKLKQHYGPKVNFNKRKINTGRFQGLPDYARCIESRLRELANRELSGSPVDHLALRTALETFETTDAFVLRYLERDASNLDFHRDDTFAYGEAILDLSLESDSVLTFLESQAPGLQTGQGECVRVPLPARSLAVVYGRARFSWDHAILAYDIVGKRTSITFRTLNETLRHSDAGRRILDIARGNASPG
jgi:alkylated DNA repair protein alkB family protein 4